MKIENKSTISSEDLIHLGFPKATAQQIIRHAKINMVKQGYAIYNNRRLSIVPIKAVENILGLDLSE